MFDRRTILGEDCDDWAGLSSGFRKKKGDVSRVDSRDAAPGWRNKYLSVLVVALIIAALVPMTVFDGFEAAE